MLKKTISYTNFNDEEEVEEFFFHLSEAELIELEVSHQGGLQAWMQRVVDAEDQAAIVSEFKNLILSSYGKKSSDGKRFVKNQQLRDEFASSKAYSTLFMELLSDTNLAIEFFNGILPNNMSEQMAKVTGADLTVVPKPEAKVITQKDLASMSGEEAMALSEKIRTGEVVLGNEPTT